MRYFAIVFVVSRSTRVFDICRAYLGDSVPHSIASCKPRMTQSASSLLNLDSLLGASVREKSGSGSPETYASTAP